MLVCRCPLRSFRTSCQLVVIRLKLARRWSQAGAARNRSAKAGTSVRWGPNTPFWGCAECSPSVHSAISLSRGRSGETPMCWLPTAPGRGTVLFSLTLGSQGHPDRQPMEPCFCGVNRYRCEQDYASRINNPRRLVQACQVLSGLSMATPSHSTICAIAGVSGWLAFVSSANTSSADKDRSPISCGRQVFEIGSISSCGWAFREGDMSCALTTTHGPNVKGLRHPFGSPDPPRDRRTFLEQIGRGSPSDETMRIAFME